MRIVNRPTYKDFEFNLSEIDKDFQAGRLTRPAAQKMRDKITLAFKSGTNNKELDKAFNDQKNNNFYVEK